MHFANLSDHSSLNRHDTQLSAGFFDNSVFAATAGTGQLMLGPFVDDFDAR